MKWPQDLLPDKIKKQRCGWCITNDHEHCITVVEMGTRASKKDTKRTGSYVWRCGCECEYSFAAKCVKCQRVGPPLRDDRCIDVEACKAHPAQEPAMLERGRKY